MHKLTQGNNAALSALSVVVNAQADALTVALDSGVKCRRENTTGLGLVQRPLPAANQNN